jgi:hypothetical protein
VKQQRKSIVSTSVSSLVTVTIVAICSIAAVVAMVKCIPKIDTVGRGSQWHAACYFATGIKVYEGLVYEDCSEVGRCEYTWEGRTLFLPVATCIVTELKSP